MTEFSDGIDDILNKFGTIGVARHIAKGEKHRQEYDWTDIEDRLRLKLDTLKDRLKDLTGDELEELEWDLDACLRVAKLFTGRKQPPGPAKTDERPAPTPITNKPPSGTDGQSEGFPGTKKNPIPLKTDIDAVNFAGLIKLADKLGVSHNESEWLDDDYPDKTDALRVAVAEAMEKVGK